MNSHGVHNAVYDIASAPTSWQFPMGDFYLLRSPNLCDIVPQHFYTNLSTQKIIVHESEQ
jgi:hypothetical protein